MACTAYASGPVARAESGPSWLKSAARLRVKLQPKARQSHLLRYRDERGDGWADIIGMLTMHPEARRRVVPLLGEIEGGDSDPAEL